MTVPRNDALAGFADWLAPETARLNRLFQGVVQRLGLDPQSASAITKVTLGAAAERLRSRRPLEDFLEQVDYNGRRLAKLQVPPDRAAAMLLDYHRLAAPLLRAMPQASGARMRAVAEQLHFRTCIVLNEAAYEVREDDTRTLLDLFHDELVSRGVDDLLRRFVATLARYCRARAARLYLANPGGMDQWKLHAATDAEPGPVFSVDVSAHERLSSFLDFEPRDAAGCVVDPDWREGSGSIWSVPLPGRPGTRGLMQFCFSKTYGSLPRERELLSAAAERCVLALDKARLAEALTRSEEQVRRLARNLIQVEEVERRRIGRELHDEAGQSLLCIRLRLEMLEAVAEGSRETGLRAGIAETRQLTERTIVETRRLIAALSPSLLTQMGLEAAIRQLVQRFRAVFAGRVRLRIGSLGRLSGDVEVTVFRIVQECCNNISHHSQASAVNLSVELADRTIRVTVEDNGVGFDTSEAFHRAGSYGLAGMRERVMLLNGSIEIESWRPGSRRKTGQGTTIHVAIPAGEVAGDDRKPQLESAVAACLPNISEGNPHVEDSHRARG